MPDVFDAVVLRPLPVEDPDRLVLFTGGFSEGTRTSNPPPTGSWDLFSTEAYRFLHEQPLPFASLACHEWKERYERDQSPAHD